MLKKLILGLALSTTAISGIASAAPCNDTPVTAPVTAWKELSGKIELKGQTDIRVGKREGEFRTLQLVAGWGNGSTMVKDVTITFGNGQTQTVCLNQKLGPTNKSVSIDLAGNERFIKSVAITGQSHGRSGIELRAA